MKLGSIEGNFEEETELLVDAELSTAYKSDAYAIPSRASRERSEEITPLRAGEL